jgi:hypothetical protein
MRHLTYLNLTDGFTAPLFSIASNRCEQSMSVLWPSPLWKESLREAEYHDGAKSISTSSAVI